MGITISADDPRSIRAIEIAAEAGRWRRWHTALGEEAFGIPSQSHVGRYYEVTQSRCDCPDFLHADGDEHVCKHVLAVRLYCELVRAQQQLGDTTPAPAPSRSHLRLVR